MASKPKGPKLADLALRSEPLSKASPDRALCQQCALFKGCSTPFMTPRVPPDFAEGRRIVGVGEAPGEHEDKVSGEPFTGPAGMELKRDRRAAGIKRRDFAVVNAVRCRPRKNATPTLTQIRACRPFLLRALEKLQPDVVIALGGTALTALQNKRGSVAKGRGRQISIPGLGTAKSPRVRATYHPATVTRGATHLREEIVRDLKRVAEPVTPWPAVKMPKDKTLGFDTEFTREEVILSEGIAGKDAVTAWDIEAPKPTRVSVEAGLKRADVLVGHSIASDLDTLVVRKLSKPGWVDGTKLRDTLILARMENENFIEKGSYGLEQVALRKLPIEAWKDATEVISRHGEDWPHELRVDRCRKDAWVARVLVDALKPDWPAKHIEFTHRLSMALRRVYLAGAVVDMSRFNALGNGWKKTADAAREKLARIAASRGMREFSPTNDADIRRLLFRRLRVPVLERTKKTGAPKIDKITLRSYLSGDHDLDPQATAAVKELLEFNTADKLVSTWFGSSNPDSKAIPLRQMLLPLGRFDHPGVKDRCLLRFHIKTMGARTGRRSSGRDEETLSPNGQNWPKAARKMVVSRFKGGRIADHDYSKLEPVLMGWLAGDEKFLKYFAGGEAYIGVGRDLFGKTVVDGTDEYRIVKSVVLGVDYGMEEFKLAWDLWYRMNVRLASTWERHLERAGKILAKYHRLFPGVRRYQRAKTHEMRRTEQVVAACGAVRHLPGYEDAPKTVRRHMRNQAGNFGIQHLASDITGGALLDIERELCSLYRLSLTEYHRMLVEDPYGLDMTVVFNEVHDDLVADLHPKHGKRDSEMIRETMGACRTFRTLVPSFDLKLKVGVTVGPAWSEAA